MKRAQLLALRKEFETLHMKTGESVDAYFSRTLAIADKMRIHGDKMKDVIVVEKNLRSVTINFDYVLCSMEESNDIDELSIDELQSSLLVHEQRMTSNVVEERALKVTTHEATPTWRGSGRGRGWGQRRGRGRNSFNQGFRPNKSSIVCYCCHRKGHYQLKCTEKFNSAKEEESNFAGTEEETLLMAYLDKEAPESDMWYLDSRCSNHICGNKSLFSNLDESFKDSVKLGNNTRIYVIGRVNMKSKIRDHIVTISGVYYVPELKSNLISMGQLQEKEYIITIQNGCYQIQHPLKRLIAKVNMIANRLFPLQIGNDIQTCFSAKVQNPTWLWHFRYGHLSFNGLNTLQPKKDGHKTSFNCFQI
ncbi:uncharacterized protein LOC112184720 [Rosa chinensis]|uniref:uncharacterized protein LOC112184720 n=1 Tax=Rosa chinensis TaxID=74649 RepID=UPI000D095733|nr:uncharacterized protein LOC112184720 [Rosa chinensis]